MSSPSQSSIQKVKAFWNANPLWTGESKYGPGSKEFFEEHKKTVIEDCYAGEMDGRVFPKVLDKELVLDLGCGPGFGTVEISRNGNKNIVAADLSEKSISLAQKRCGIYGVDAKLCVQNAEELGFRNETFLHVNCQGVIHHTSDTEACLKEISRVLKKSGTACVSVYYLNIFLRFWPLIRGLGKIFARFGFSLRGRGRERIYEEQNIFEIVRLFDGSDNPIGKCYTKKEFQSMLSPYFHVEQFYFHFFPARSLPFKLPKLLHKFLDIHAGFLIYANLKKR